jgi:serine/threonine-protein kinase
MEPGARFCPNDGTPLTETASEPTVTVPGGGRPATVALELPAVVGGRYRLDKLLGGGGMAKVYRGVDLTLERDVAVKLINPELRADPEFDARFQREAKIASQLSDPHIIVVHDYGIDPTLGPFLVMELLQGCSLRERLQKEGPLPLKACMQLSAQLMLALLHAHEKGIVHRDIKPDNIFLLNQSGVRLHVRVLDFGIARIYKRGETGQSETLTAAGAVLGTPRYMSPEQLAGQLVDARSDLYSAALVIHESLTGQLPYTSGKKLTQLCPEASNVLQELIEECMRPAPAERPPSAVEVYLRLQELGKASGILLLPSGAMDKLVAARRAALAGNPAAAPPQRKPVSLPMRFLLIMTVLIAVLGGVALAKKLFFPTTPSSSGTGPESLLDVRIGDAEAEVVKRLGVSKVGVMNPWAAKVPPVYPALILQPGDLGLGDEAVESLDVYRSADGHVCALFHDSKVVAVIVTEAHTHGKTGKGVGIHSSVNDLYSLYDMDSEPKSIEIDDGRGGTKHGLVHHFNQLGVGFLIQGKVVTSIALYPPKAAP